MKKLDMPSYADAFSAHNKPPTPNTMNTQAQLNKMYDTILELELCTVEELELVTSINGFNEQAMNDLVYVPAGYQTLDQYVEQIEADTGCTL